MVRIRLNRVALDGSQGFVHSGNLANFSNCSRDEGDTSIGERGVPEYVLAYKDRLPRRDEEPELFSIPHYSLRQPWGDYWLCFPLSTVILTTEKADAEYREQNPEQIARIEVLLVY